MPWRVLRLLFVLLGSYRMHLIRQFNLANNASTARLVLPGVLLAGSIAAIAFLLASLQNATIGYALLDPLVIGLVIGLLVRATWSPPATFEKGIAFAGKQLLEFAIVVLGITLNLGALIDAGWKILASVLVLVAMMLVVGISLGKAMGLNTRMATLVAVGNAICGNSAIAAVAPVIRARKEEVAAAIALTAVLGVGVVLALPLLVPVLNLSHERYGVVAGLSVYAVPQVLAATFSVSATAGQIGSLVKLTRVMMLGPVVALFAWMYREKDEDRASRLQVSKFLPWFVLGFFVFAGIRTAGFVPAGWIQPATDFSRILTAIAMAGLGLGVDIRTVRQFGGGVVNVVLILTVLLVASALIVTAVLGIG